MADIHNIISLGIGSPASIEHFILFGLNGESGVQANPSVGLVNGVSLLSTVVNGASPGVVQLNAVSQGAGAVDGVSAGSGAISGVSPGNTSVDGVF